MIRWTWTAAGGQILRTWISSIVDYSSVVNTSVVKSERGNADERGLSRSG
jgi:hypothetical protein